MTFIYLVGAIVLGAVVFWWWQGVGALKALENGAHGDFKMTRTSGSGDSYLAVDSTSRKLALVNSSVPVFNGRGDVISHRNMTVVFSFTDVASVSVTRNEKTSTVVFSFFKPIPAWNIRKELTYISGDEIRAFFERYVPELKVGYFTKNQYGGVDSW